jgi:ATP-dependent DNA helicase PIF1
MQQYIRQQQSSLLIVGSGGTGKTWTVKHIYRDLHHCYLTSTTGVSAFSIGPPATTLHHFAGIGLGHSSLNQLIRRISSQKLVVNRYQQCRTLIIDEFSMLGKKLFELIDQLFRYFRHNDNPFGGIQLILVGDPLQLQPVEDDYCFESDVFKAMKFICFRLTIPYRFTDSRYFELLSRARIGQLNTEDEALLQQRLEAYQQQQQQQQQAALDSLIEPTLLYPHNLNVDSMNHDYLNQLAGAAVAYSSKDQVKYKLKTIGRVLSESDITERIWIPEILYLKKHAQIMITVNLDIDQGLVNGSRGIVTQLFSDGVQIELINRTRMMIHPYEFQYEDEQYCITRKQLPIRLAWALSIHKSQSCTLDYCVADLGSGVFSPGMSYVALSRVRSLDSLFLIRLDVNRIKPNLKALQFDQSVEIQPD